MWDTIVYWFAAIVLFFTPISVGFLAYFKLVELDKHDFNNNDDDDLEQQQLSNR